MGKFHPHGDSSIYLAMAHMAQNFSYRYMLVDGHGNFGSVDGDEPAAMRYTEARMSKIAVEMLRDINKNTVDWQRNYDDTENEPVVLPARIPNLLVNGASGIAVGMTTNIPPHNLSEVISGIHMLMDNPEVTTKDLMKAIPGLIFLPVVSLWVAAVFTVLITVVRAILLSALRLILKLKRAAVNELSSVKFRTWSIRLS